MKNLKYLIISTLLFWSCSGDVENQEIDDAGKCEYTINVNFQFSLNGSDIFWDSQSGNMSLGPENSNCTPGVPTSGDPVGSLWMRLKPNLNTIWSEHLNENNEIDTSSIDLFDFNFYSILYWCADLGEQESNWYSLSTRDSNGNSMRPFEWDHEEGNPKFEIGFDERGLSVIKIEALKIKMSRDIINEADVEENIVLYLNCTGFEFCP